WFSVGYAAARVTVRAIATALLKRGLSAERPLVILSGKTIDHAMMALAALYAGIPFCPVSPAYSLVSKDFGKLRHAV
ncbi:feruloyl-CoA synthase, partial [Acinetobacter baumannii]